MENTAPKYNVGDRVLIKSLEWYHSNRHGSSSVRCKGDVFLSVMTPMCGKVVTIKEVRLFNPNENIYSYGVEEFSWNWTEDMFVGRVEDMQLGIL